METFLFYDLETSGLSPAFDQILTFAAIRTRPDFKEIERHSLVIRLRRDVIPSPRAFITHCLTGDVLDKGESEYRAAQKIHHLFNTPETVSIGYNSLGFDDEFLRFMFYRNLLDPYSHQYAGGCRRVDILPVATLFRVFCESAIKWPSLENGKPSLKLELLSRENRFETSGKAHEAMADVEALIQLSKRLSVQQDVWDYALGFFDKPKDLARITAIEPDFPIGGKRFRLGIIISASFGPEANYLAPVINIGHSTAYKNQDLWVRLDMDQVIDGETGAYDWFVIRKRPADEIIVLPYLDRFGKRLAQKAKMTARSNLETLKASPELFWRSVEYFVQFKYPYIPDIDPDADLYQSGFFTFAEKKEINRFQKASDQEKPKIVSRLKSPRIQNLAGRILSRNFKDLIYDNPEFEDHVDRLISSAERQTPVKGYRNDEKNSLRNARKQLNEIMASDLGPDQQRVFNWLRKYLETL